MATTDVPYEELQGFKDSIGLDLADIERLTSFRDVFVAKKADFARFFYDAFYRIPETRRFLEHEKRPGFLLSAWEHWFERLFRDGPAESLFSYLWKVGVRHVEVNLDQRFSNLGFALVRGFCHRLIQDRIPSDQAPSVFQTVNGLLDLCVLVETTAYVESTTRCDVEVIRGIADRVRNPATVIGGTVTRLRKRLDASDPVFDAYGRIMAENRRLERMVHDVGVYSDIFEREIAFNEVRVGELIDNAIQRLRSDGKVQEIEIEICLDESIPSVQGDPYNLEEMLYHLVENGLEAAGESKNPRVRITSRPADVASHSLRIEIDNTGAPPRDEDLQRLFSPFFSTKLTGTGFGLPIAVLAVQKNYGEITMERLADEGTRVVITLPTPTRSDLARVPS